MNQRLYSFCGNAIALASALLFVSCALQKKKTASSVGILLASTAGIVAGAQLASHPIRKAEKTLPRLRLLNDADVTLMQQNIAEVLNQRNA